MVMEKSARVKSIQDNNYFLEYLLVKSTANIQEIGETLSYGIMTKMIDSIGNVLDFKQILDISTSPQVVEGLIAKISRNSVTPCTLEDVIEDFLAS